jgi:rare lipoprotein A
MLNRFLAALALACLQTCAYEPAHGQTWHCSASWYFEGSRTANGERFRPDGLTAAHRTLPFNTKLRVTYRGRSAVVRINDRGPFIHGRCLDLSRGAARALGLDGVDLVTFQILN